MIFMQGAVRAGILPVPVHDHMAQWMCVITKTAGVVWHCLIYKSDLLVVTLC